MALIETLLEELLCSAVFWSELPRNDDYRTQPYLFWVVPPQFSSHHTRYEQKHPTVEAFPFLSDGKCERLIHPDGRESWRRLDKVEG